jgi:adenosine kinase
MSILVSGSVALDHIMVFPDRFRDHILPEKLHMLNVSFNISSMKVHFGGVAGNIAYMLKLLGADSYILATAGNDFGPYADWLDRHGISRAGIRIIEDLRTAQGFVTTDIDDNQIWAFYVGAMAHAHEARVDDIKQEIRIAIVSSNGKEAMLEHAQELKRRRIPTFIDPSHGLPILSREELIELIDGCAAYIVNDYEWSVTLEKTGLGEDEIQSRCDAVIITRGPEGSEIRSEGQTVEIPAISAEKVVDPTGCGDAYRAGLLYGRTRDMSWETAGRIGSLIGALQVEVDGPQNLTFEMAEFRARYEREYGSNF